MVILNGRVADKDWGADFRKLSAGSALVGLTLWLDHMQVILVTFLFGFLVFRYPHYKLLFLWDNYPLQLMFIMTLLLHLIHHYHILNFIRLRNRSNFRMLLV